MTQNRKFVTSLARSFLIVTSVFSLFDYLENPKALKMGSTYSNYKYLLFTKISLFITIVAAVSGIINRLTGNYHFVKNFLLPISFTFEFIVTSVYWTLFVIDKRLIVDKESLVPGNETPLISQLASHIFPLILSCIEYIDFDLKPQWHHLIFFIFFGIFYYTLVTIYASLFGKYVYPFLDHLGTFQRVLFFVGVAGAGLCVYLAQCVFFKPKEIKDVLLGGGGTERLKPPQMVDDELIQEVNREERHLG